MTRTISTIATAAFLVGILAACQTATATEDVPPIAATEAPPVIDVRQAMVDGVNPAALAIWDVGNNAMDDTGMIDPAQMDDTKWGQVREAAQMLAVYGRRMANAGEIKAAGPDLVGGQVPEGVASREEIQAMIDANPRGFRALSEVMAQHADQVGAAAEARDVEALSDLVLTFDTSCQACHEQYWYKQ